MDDKVVIEDIYQPALKDVLLNEFEIEELQKEKELVYNFTNIHYLELKKWPIFNLLSLDFIKQIYMVLIIDENGAIIATRDGLVHALGNNNNGKLGIVNIRNILQPIQIDIFYKETIDKFVCCLERGRTALLANGKVYFWGTNEVLSSDTLYTFYQITDLKNNYIKDLVCGMKYFLFLTISGKVYFWGVETWKINLKDIERDVHNNEHDSTKDDTSNTDLFYKINFNGNKVVFIACGAHFNVAITDEDQVYSWGSNIYGQLGIDEVPHVSRLKTLNSIYKSTPHEITTLSKKNIVKIVCGSAHSLALTKKGQLYVWGGNHYKQSGTIKYDVKLLCCPVMLEMEVKILDIAANYLHHTSVALGSDERIYIWGYWNNEEINTPTITQFLNMYDIFLHKVPYMIYNIMPVNKYERKCDAFKILGCIQDAFNSDEKTDLIIQVEKQSIYVHKAILVIRSTYFRYMFQHDWADKNIREEQAQYNFTRQHPFELKRWPMLNLLDSNFIMDIYKIMIFGEHGEAFIIAMRNNMVYALGTNDNERLGFENVENVTNKILYPEKIKMLSGYPIKKFCCCLEVCNAALLNGKVYFWGTSTFQSVHKTPFELDELRDKEIIDVACSATYFLFLTADKNLCIWGKHSYNVNVNEHHLTEDHIHITNKFEIILDALSEKRISHIACGSNFSIVITYASKVYSWGNNEYGQLGHTVENPLHKINKQCNKVCYSPVEITTFSDKIITRVVCGKEHTLALSNEGKLYTWGRNNYGQLGIGNEKDSPCPNLLSMKEKILDVAAVYTSDISVALGCDNHVYVWGCCFGEKIATPIITSFSNIYDVFTYNVPFITNDCDFDHVNMPIRVNKTSNRILQCIQAAFNDSKTSDLVIKVNEKSIYVHKTILMLRSKFYEIMFTKVAEKNLSVIEDNQFSYVVYKAYLEYLYTATIKLSTIEDVLELLTLANTNNEIILKYQCSEMIIESGITTLNVIFIYNLALQCNMKDLEEYCFQFILKDTTTILSKFFNRLDDNTQLYLINKMAMAKAFKTIVKAYSEQLV
ncbi:RCC1 and BTB domain-containing protein 1-like [Nylanderia fulva]|uniref:RCC1 and BTB domain-containing protein 1-like n=1 Tax=Nylanderia fulva TaxID=613905 RepID=UPI0010FAF58B|nr:RCC1 and BTB domain-containing protein 1-like [Nylanderia fulva]